MKILFIIYHGFSEYSGISKKIIAQANGLRENGHGVHICTYIVDRDGSRKRMADEEAIANYGNGMMAKIKKRCCYGSILRYIERKQIDMVYVRSFHNANPFTIHLFKKIKSRGVKVVMEIPTYPYDAEYRCAGRRTKLNLQIDKLFRKALAGQTDLIVTFSNEQSIFGQRTVCISNGIDFTTIPVRTPSSHHQKEIHLIGVAEVHYWHGYDRLIHGLGIYYQGKPEKEIFFHIIGNIDPPEMLGSPQAPGFQSYIRQYDIEKYVIFHKPQYGDKLDALFNEADFAIGSLGRHRTGIRNIKTLKNREYAARGIPFIYSETDSDFDTMPYIIKAPADESPIDVKQIIDFISRETGSPENIRKSIQHLSWKVQMEKVINAV